MPPKARAREVFKDLKYFNGVPGTHNAITDVPGVSVGFCNVRKTLSKADGTPDYTLRVGEGPIITGVTAILPRPKEQAPLPVLAGIFSFNGNGELTGSHWIEEAGQAFWPFTITNTHSVGVCRDSSTKWLVKNFKHKLPDIFWHMPVAGEWDGWLNDLNGFHVKEEHVFSAIDAAASGPVQEGSVGGGSGMINYEFKGGSGTSSRVVDLGAAGTYTVGVFLQANFGRREQLVIAGVPVGRKFPLTTDANPYSASTSKVEVGSQGNGSLIAILGTDAPLVPHQLKRLARRIPIGVARTGTSGDNGSGDVFLAFTTANAESLAPGKDAAELATVKMLPDKFMDPLFEAVAEVVEEAILNVLCAGETTIGRDGHVVPEMPIDAVLDYMKALGRDKWN